MNMQLHAEENLPFATIEQLIARHGGWRILREVLAALLRCDRKSAPGVSEADLSAHLRRDVGLPPVPASPRHWDIRL